MSDKHARVAYFSAEIGICSSMPTYSGGLGVLAGDYIKAAADLGVPMVAVTLLYKEGYFKQHLDEFGVQTETYPRFEPEPLLTSLRNRFTLRLRERDVWIQAYEYGYRGINGHKVMLYFLDTDLEQNFEDDRTITLRLYSGDKDHRVLQEAILGFGGIRLLNELGYDEIETYHLNEGHCSFLTLELLENFNRNSELLRSKCHFTTHTPVPAGHDHFAVDRCRKLLHGLLPKNLELPSWVEDSRLHMTELGLFFSGTSNAVSKLHEEVAQEQFPWASIESITNGVYHPYWIGESFRGLYDLELPGWREDPERLLDVDTISDEKLMGAHLSQKQSLLSYVNSQRQRALSEDVLTLGFARRAAEYKRANLIFHNLDYLIEIAGGKLQIIFAGKAHPKDERGKALLKQVQTNAEHLRGSIKVVLLEDYDLWLGRLLTAGVDVWLNTPLRPNEASGTSGMKAALNGIPNLSILDGWWAEACENGVNGWSVGEEETMDDATDASSLYNILSQNVIPIFYRDPKRWLSLVRSSIKTSVKFTAKRMVEEYVNKFYRLELISIN